MNNDQENNSIEKDAAKEQQKEYWREHNKRRTQKQQLQMAAANFCNRILTSKANLIDRETMTRINLQVRKIIKLPYCWTNEDLLRAKNALAKLEEKYLNKRYSNLPENEGKTLSAVRNILDSSDLSNHSKAQILLTLLTDTVQELYLHEGNKIQPSPENALLFLTQDMKYHVPEWFDKEVIKLLQSKYGGSNTDRLMKKLQISILAKRSKEAAAREMQRIMEEIDNNAIDIKDLLKKK